MIEHKIGEIITLPDGTKAEVKAAKSHLFQCSDCVLLGNSICYDLDCDETERDDHTTIHYKEIKEYE